MKGIGVFSIYYTGQEFDVHNHQHIKSIFLGAYGSAGASGPESKSGGILREGGESGALQTPRTQLRVQS